MFIILKHNIMAEYKTPGVYIEEIPNSLHLSHRGWKLLPAFIGYTEKAQFERAG